MEELRHERAAPEPSGEPLPKALVGRPLIVNNPRTPATVRRLLLQHGQRDQVIPEIDIWQAASLLIRQHGDTGLISFVPASVRQFPGHL